MTDPLTPRQKRKVNWGKLAAGAARIAGAFADEPPAPGAAAKNPDLAEDFIGAVNDNTQAVRALAKAVRELKKAVDENTDAMFEDDEEEGT